MRNEGERKREDGMDTAMQLVLASIFDPHHILGSLLLPCGIRMLQLDCHYCCWKSSFTAIATFVVCGGKKKKNRHVAHTYV